ncbi:MAG: hypothetical protein FJZ43_03910, partial [Candidatus Staskawiczbacteria bacterium]|nr:hypothetical protein [Candidatus Staskawiczbacteria bacterium]
NDEVLDETDNCPLISNTNQADNDNDGIGNVCDDTPGEPISATLTVTKVVNGGTKSVSDFPLFVSATPVSSGVATTFSAGTYTVSETNQDNYTAVISGDCSSTGIVILETGQSRSCTITNTFTAPQNNNNSGGGSGGGGGGGGTPPSPTLVIIESSIAYSNITENGMTITWDTNLPASSYIVYSLASASDQLDNLDNSGTPPTYGYQFSTPELDINPKTTSHTATLTGMTPNTPYHFRLVSRGSLAFSNEYKMTFGEITQTPVSNPTPIPTPTGGSNNQGVGTSGLGQQVAGGSTVVEDILEENTGSNEGEETSDEIQSTNAIQTAALSEAGGQGFIDWLSANWWWLLLLLILIALIAYYYWREQNKGKK